MQKFKKFMVMSFAAVMLLGAGAGTLQTEAAETVSAETLLDLIKNTAPEISSDGTHLILPEIDSDTYEVRLYGSSNEAVIGTDGTIYTPLEDMKVTVMYQVVNINDPEDTAEDHWTEAEITVPGKYETEVGDNEKPDVIPGLREWKGSQGEFELSEESRIVIEEESLNETAQRIAYYFQEMLGREIEIAEDTPAAGDIYLAYTDAAELGEEGYTLEIADMITVNAYQPKGAFYGGTTLTQILSQDETHTAIPKGLVRDYPQYEVRACMLDVARFYMPLDYLEEVTKYMAYYKLNEVRVHINDNGGEQSAAFRVESKKYPEINSSLNPEEVYSQEDYKNYQKECAKYGIKVVTEIDSPAHSGFVGLYDSSLLLDGYHIDLSKKAAVEFMKSLFDEFLDGEDPVFQGGVFHIGTDEYDKSYSEQVRAYMNELINYVNGKGYETRMWASLGSNGFAGTTPVSTDVTAHYWSGGWASYDEMIDAGYKCINNADGTLYVVPGAGYYNDYLNIENLYNHWEATKLNSQYTLAASSPLMLGSEAACWYDSKTGMSQFDVFDRVRDQVMLMSEKNWCGNRLEGQTGAEFLERIAKVDKYAPGSNPARYVESETEVVAEYDFETADAGFAADSSGNEYDGALNGVTVTEENGNHVLQLNGEGSFDLPLESVGFPYTVQFDLYLDSEIAENAVLFSGKDGTLYLNYNGTGKIGYERKGYTYLLDYTLSTGIWQKIILTCDHKDVKLYVNNIFTASGEYYHVTAAKQESSTFVLPTAEIGTGVKGKLDNLRIVNCDLGDEITGLDEIDYANVALKKPVQVSGLEVDDGRYTGEMAVDGDLSTRISLERKDDAWFMVDLEDVFLIDKIEIVWNERPKKYQIYISEDGEQWNLIYEDLNCNPQSSGTELITDDALMSARYVKYQQLEMFEAYGSGYSGNFKEFRVWAYGGDFADVLTEAKNVFNETAETENNRIFLKRYAEHIRLTEEAFEEKDASKIAVVCKLLKEQTERLKAGNTEAAEVDTAELEKALSVAFNSNYYTDESRTLYETECSMGFYVLMDMDSEQENIDLAVRRIRAAEEALVIRPIVTLTTNKSVYQDYSLEKLVDGDVNTLCWLSANQKIGDYIQFRFREAMNLTKVRVISEGAGSDIIGSADFQISFDGQNWKTVGTLSDQKDQTITFDETEVFYARIRLTGARDFWLKLNEVVFNDSYLIDTALLEKELQKEYAEDQYTAESYEAYKAAVAAAQEVLANEDKTQKAVDDALAALQEAAVNLQEKEELPEVRFEITKQPENVTAVKGENAVVTVEATGTDLTYTWYYKNPGNKKFYVSGSAFAEGNTYQIQMNSWRDGQQVYCVVTDGSGAELTSEIVTLSIVKAGIEITKQPESVTVKRSGETAVVTVEAAGNDLTYTWYYKNPGNVKFYASGSAFAEGNTYQIQVNKWRDGQQVYCVITDANGDSVQTETVTLSIQK